MTQHPPSIVISYYLQNKFINDCKDQCIEVNEEEEFCTMSIAAKLNSVGSQESQRLLRSLRKFLAWIRLQNECSALQVIHILDDTNICNNPERNKWANEMILDLGHAVENRVNESVVKIRGISAFSQTNLHELIANKIEPYMNCEEKPKISVVGVHSDSNIHYLMYELASRFPYAQLATCSALTATRSRLQHFNTLGQMHKLLQTEIYDSVYDFKHFILKERNVSPTLDEESRVAFDCVEGARLKEESDYLSCGINWSTIGEDKNKISDIEKEIVCDLYRDSSEVRLQKLSGGFSGSYVFRVTSNDIYGHRQSTTVLKVGKRKPIVRERVNFERVEDILGNNAPRLIGFSEYADRAGIK
jgi:hypothetical protein